MGGMATWEDGPEYAPTARPDAFVSPDAAPLAPPPTQPTPDADAAPLAPRPDYAPPPAEAVPLERIESPRPPGRDPRQAFAVDSSPLTSAGRSAMSAGAPPLPAPPPASSGWGPQQPASAPAGALPPWGPPAPQPTGAWGAAHVPQATPRPPQHWAPEQPFQPPAAPPMSMPAPAPAWPPPQVNPSAFPPPDVPPWYSPQQPPTGPAPLRRVSFGEMVQSTTPAVVISLLVAGIVWPLSLPLYLVAMVLAARVQRRRRQVTLAFRVGLGASIALGAAAAWLSLEPIDVFLLWEYVNDWVTLASWAVGAAVVLIQGDALRRNEPPESYL